MAFPRFYLQVLLHDHPSHPPIYTRTHPSTTNQPTDQRNTHTHTPPSPTKTRQALAIPAVTQIRVSDDYGPSLRPDQWALGDSALLSHSLGLVPFKVRSGSAAWGKTKIEGKKKPVTARARASMLSIHVWTDRTSGLVEL